MQFRIYKCEEKCNLTLRVASCPPDHGCPPRLRRWAGPVVTRDSEAVREWAGQAGHAGG